jgi:RimJ/RimL family protein N-acetyltransferase
MRDPAFRSIETEHVRLRRFTTGDAAALRSYRADAEVARFQSWQDFTLERAERFVQEMSQADPGVPGEPYQFAVARIDDDTLVGDCMLALDAGDPAGAEIGYTVAPRHQGRGHATESVRALLDYAFERHSVAWVRAVTDTRNEPSIAVAGRVGMRRIGTVHSTFKGEPCEEHTYAISRDEWATTPS